MRVCKELMGVSTGSVGEVTMTDDDVIEKSNLSRQFLFRDWDIGRYTFPQLLLLSKYPVSRWSHNLASCVLRPALLQYHLSMQWFAVVLAVAVTLLMRPQDAALVTDRHPGAVQSPRRQRQQPRPSTPRCKCARCRTGCRRTQRTSSTTPSGPA